MRQYSVRLKEIYSFGVTHFLPTENTRIGKVAIAGKGCVGIVLKVRIRNKVCALKVRRTDANRNTMKKEAGLHQIANSVGVGPILHNCSENLLSMEYIDGRRIIDWINKEEITQDDACKTVVSILEQCRLLDIAGIDHGQLSCLNQHVIVSPSNNLANIIDFESSSTIRKPSNVTAAAQSLFLSGPIATRLNQLLGFGPRDRIIQLLKNYKREPSKIKFDRIMDICYSWLRRESG
jgi:putative serine/threonine protein kinase